MLILKKPYYGQRRQKMKDSLILGMLAGMAIGAVLAHTCEPVQKAVEKGKAELKKQVEKL